MNKYLLIYILFTCNSFVVLGKDIQPKVLLAVENSWPPFAKADGTGLSRTIVEKAYKLTNYDVEFIVVPYARALHMAESGKVDGVFNVTKQASTEQNFYFGRHPILTASASYYYPPESILDFANLQSVPDGTSLALIIGYEYGNMYEQHRSRFSEVRLAKQNQIINMLLTSKVDAAIMFDEVAKYTAGKMPKSGSKIRKGAVNHVSDIYVAFSKKRIGVEAKLQALDLGLTLLQKGAKQHKAQR